MRRSANSILHAIKDQVRNVRYTIRVEAETPGESFPKAVGNIDLAPLIAIGSVVSSPALKMVDGLFTRVETLATDVMRAGALERYPLDVSAYFAEGATFSGLLYDVYKRLLQAKGVRNVLLSEHAFDQAQSQFRVRHCDEMVAKSRPDFAARATKACAGLTCALADNRPIRKLAFGDGGLGSQNFILSPNIYCGAVIGLVTALVTRDESLAGDVDSLHESVESVVEARFDRFKRALTSKAPLVDLTAQFEAVLPYMP